MRQGKNVLFISRQRLVGATNGSSTYLLQLAAAVRAAGMNPHLVQPSPTIAGRLPLLTMRPEMDVFATHEVRGLIRIGRRFISPCPSVYLIAARGILSALARRLGVTASWALDRPLPYSVSIPWTDIDHAWIRRVSRGKADIAIADYMFCADGFGDLGDSRIKTGIVMHDLFHTRQGGEFDSVATVSAADEIAMLGRADAVIAIQAAEAGFVDLHVPGVHTIIAPMAAAVVKAAQPGCPDIILFVGSNTAPNSVGLQWFFEKVWPRVRTAWPRAHLEIAGSVARAFPQGGPAGVSFLGLVDDLAPLYARAGIVISPLTFGSGLKIKLIEALAMGKAIVATSVTMQGVERECEGAVRVTDEPREFADHIFQLQANATIRAAQSQAALDVAREQFAAGACYATFTEWLTDKTSNRDK